MFFDRLLLVGATLKMNLGYRMRKQYIVLGI